MEVDCLPGDVKVVRADILMDLGASINPSHRQRSDRGGIRAGEMEPRLLLRTAVLSVLLVLYRDG